MSTQQQPPQPTPAHTSVQFQAPDLYGVAHINYDAAQAQFTAWLDRLRESGLAPADVKLRMENSGMASHEPLRSFLELWYLRASQQEEQSGMRENVYRFARLMDKEITRQGWSAQTTSKMYQGRPAPSTIPLHLLQHGDPSDHYAETFFQALQRLQNEVELLRRLFWEASQQDVQTWVQAFLQQTAAVAVQALRMARNGARYYGQRTAARRMPPPPALG